MPAVPEGLPDFADLAGSPPQDDKIAIQVDTPTKEPADARSCASPQRRQRQNNDFDKDVTPTPHAKAHFDLEPYDDGPTPRAT